MLNHLRLPYIGVTGFMSRNQIDQVLTEEASASLQERDRRLMCGVLASWKTLNGRRPEGKWAYRYPSVNDIASIFRRDRTCLNLVHYNSKESGLAGQLIRLHHLVGDVLDGYQLNITWPDPEEINEWLVWVKHSFGDERSDEMRVVVQVNRGAFASVDGDLSALCERLKGYRGIASDILFDLSGGDGTPFDPSEAARVLETIDDRLGRYMNIGIAGGLGPSQDDLARVAQLFQRFPKLSIDAEGKLRSPQGDGDVLDTDKARRHVLESLKFLT